MQIRDRGRFASLVALLGGLGRRSALRDVHGDRGCADDRTIAVADG